MANYEIPENPVYNAEIRKLENEDTISADDTFNPLFSRLMENMAALKNESGGSTSGDADTVDGKHAADLQNYNNLENKPVIVQNLMDGNAMGALRSVGAKSDYTMGKNSFAESCDTTASGDYSHAEGYGTTASGDYSHAEGYDTTALGFNSHAEGRDTTASGDYSHAEGYGTTAYMYAHAEGYGTTASGLNSYAEGRDTTASGAYSHAEGCDTTASGDHSHAEGRDTTALAYQHAQGHYNKGTDAEGSYNTTNGSAFIIGNGTSDTVKSNCFRVQFDGKTFAKGAYSTTGADYAELFEWADGNHGNEDRRGLFVALQGTKVQLANSTADNIIGIISSNPAVIGNNHSETWKDMYITDIWGDVLTEKKTIPAEYRTIKTSEMIEDENGIMQKIEKEEQILIHEEHEAFVPVLNPDYNNDEEYIPRHERQEWGIVGMFGQLILQDDGSCTVGGYCQCTDAGAGTSSDNGYYVMERINEKYIKVLFK